ncbi:unnamed protein product, partial [Musa acuminata subsp. malaccensis]
ARFWYSGKTNLTYICPIETIRSCHGKTSYGFDVLLSSTNGPAFNAGRSIWLPGWLNAVNENCHEAPLYNRAFFLVHHAIALGLHTTTFI